MKFAVLAILVSTISAYTSADSNKVADEPCTPEDGTCTTAENVCVKRTITASDASTKS